MHELPVGVRIAVGWAVGLLAIAVVWGLADARKGTAGAEAGSGRQYLVLMLVVIPLLAGARWLAEVDRSNTVAAVALPIVLGLLVAGMVWWAGFVPDESLRCAAVSGYGIETPASCITTSATRLRALAEGLAAWGAFGLATVAWRRLQRAVDASSGGTGLDPHTA